MTSRNPMTAMACQQAIAMTPQMTDGTASGLTSGNTATTLSTSEGITHTCVNTDKSSKTIVGYPFHCPKLLSLLPLPHPLWHWQPLTPSSSGAVLLRAVKWITRKR